jgi:hypothetical protein
VVEGAGHDPSGRHGVPGTRRRLGPVAEDAPRAVSRTRQVRRHHGELPAAGQEHTGRGDEEALVADDELGGEQPLAQRPAFREQVDEDRVEQPCSLGEPGLEPLPLRGLDEDGQRVDLPRHLRAVESPYVTPSSRTIRRTSRRRDLRPWWPIASIAVPRARPRGVADSRASSSNPGPPCILALYGPTT